MLVGQLLFVEPAKVIKTALLYALVGLVHFRWRRPFMMISFDSQQAEVEGLAVRWWDFLFYATFGAVVTSSVQMAGVLLVFSYLIVPAVCAMLFFERVLPRLCFGWAVGFVGSVLGIRLSVTFDMPTGASIVVSFGALVVVLMCIRAWLARRRSRP
jgi:zinc/manganese transport system permease protein